MAVYVVRRLLQAIPLLVGLSFAGFVLLRLAPGGPMAVYAQNPSMSEADMRRIERILGLDRPIHVQYLKWAAGMARGELGYSYRTGRPVGEIIREQASRDDHHGGHEEETEDHRVILVVERVEVEPAHARPREHRLGHQRAAEEVAELQPAQRDERDERIAQRVAQEHRASP